MSSTGVAAKVGTDEGCDEGIDEGRAVGDAVLNITCVVIADCKNVKFIVLACARKILSNLPELME
jgi:hypothetical protein